MKSFSNNDSFYQDSSEKNEPISCTIQSEEQEEQAVIERMEKSCITTTTTTTKTRRQFQHDITSSIAPATKVKKKFSGVRNQHKMKYFVKWLVETFPQLNNVPRTRSKDIQPDGTLCSAQAETIHVETPLERIPLVIDVAGGKGELAARLVFCQRLRVIMIDPRESNVPLCFEKTVLPKLPAIWRKRFLQRQKEDPKVLENTFRERFQQYQMYFMEDTIISNPEMEALIQSATVLVGMHADGATEAIVNIALRYQKPFCVVPCCVFPNLFQTRTLFVHDEQHTNNIREIPVRSYEQFCQYLLNKDPRFQQSILPIEGRNIAIWWDGKP